MERMNARPLEDFSMWAALQSGGQTFDPEELRTLVRQWIRMATQKTAGQEPYAKKGDVSTENLERVKMGILCEAVALVLSGELDKIEGTRK